MAKAIEKSKQLYPLRADLEAKRKILEILSQPSRFALLALLMSREDAMTIEDIKRAFPAVQVDTFRARVIPPLKEMNILEVTKGGAARYGSEYYIAPEASDFVQKLLKLLFTDDESKEGVTSNGEHL